MFSKVAGHRVAFCFEDVARFMKTNLDENCYGYVIEINRAEEKTMPDSKAAVEQRLKQRGISLPVSHGLFSYSSMYYLTVLISGISGGTSLHSVPG